MIDDGFKLFAERFHPILDVFAECGVKFALEVHPTEIAFDIYTAERALEALDHREEFGFNFDPSHLHWQGSIRCSSSALSPTASITFT
jgi:sugar phosphate isomerase/epimerase